MGCVGLYEHASGSEYLTRGVAENFIAEGNFFSSRSACRLREGSLGVSVYEPGRGVRSVF